MSDLIKDATDTFKKKISDDTKKRCAEALCAECKKFTPGKAEHYDGEKCGEYKAIMEVE